MHLIVTLFLISSLSGNCIAREYWFLYTGTDSDAYQNTYYDAAAHCASLGTTLATIETAEDVANAMTSFDPNVWGPRVGLTETDGVSWSWDDGTSFTFHSNWASNEPKADDDCAIFNYALNTGKFYGYPCDQTTRAWLCNAIETTSTPTIIPTYYPTRMPSGIPTAYPTHYPTYYPTKVPTNVPTTYPTYNPTYYPTAEPTYDDEIESHLITFSNTQGAAITTFLLDITLCGLFSVFGLFISGLQTSIQS